VTDLGLVVLGGCATFSTYVVDTGRLLLAAAPRPRAYLVGTVLAALAAAYTGIGSRRWLIFRRRR
jgi:CrcB protein